MYKSDLDVCNGVPSEFPERGVTASATSSNGWDKIGVDVAEAETSSNGSGALPSMEWAADHVAEGTIQFLVSMQATKPEILRGIMVHRFLQHAPLIWARRTGLDTLHGLSEVTTTLDEFWSHSWQVKAYLKYINILHRHNSFSAFVVGTLCAFAAWALCVAGILPDGPAWVMTSRFWSTPAGLVGYYLTLFMWRRQKKAFLDIACINQTDDLIKAEGLVSMGAFLKRSETLFVLWDVTYVSRLWCLFELAAFLHSKGLGTDAEKHLVICPVFVGPALVLGQLGLAAMTVTFSISQLEFIPWGLVLISALAFPFFMLLAYVVLAHCRSIEMVQDQVRNFTIENSLSFCCSCGHVHPQTGSVMLCDRSIIVRCIAAWFESVQEFETIVRGKVLKFIVHQLANQVFSYWRIVQACCPLLWFYLDVPSVHDARETLKVAAIASAYSFMLMPAAALICLRLAYRMRKLFHGRCRKLLFCIGLVAAGALLFAVGWAFDFFLETLSVLHFGTDLPGNFALLVIAGVVNLLVWYGLPDET